MKKNRLNGKEIAKAILGGLNVPFFSIGSVCKEILFDSVEKQENEKRIKKMESLLQRMDDDVIERLEGLNANMRFVALTQIPKTFPDETKNKIRTILEKADSHISQEEQNRLAFEFWDLIAYAIKHADNQELNLNLKDSLSIIQQTEERIKDTLIKSISISSVLLALMDASRKACQEKDIPYRTPNLLLVLLQMPNSLAKQFLNRIEKDVGQEFQDGLESYVKSEQPKLEVNNSYNSFDWSERDDIRLAQIEAFNDRYPVVTQKHLLLGILQSDSKTKKEIRGKLDNKFQELLDIVRKESPSSINSTSTPGPILSKELRRDSP